LQKLDGHAQAGETTAYNQDVEYVRGSAIRGFSRRGHEFIFNSKYLKF